MLDSYFRKKYQAICIDPWLGKSFVKYTSPNTVTYLACIFGVFSATLVYYDFPITASVSLLFSGYLDTIDGSIARAFNKMSDTGGALDIVLDRIVEFSIVFALFLINPIERAQVSLWIMAGILFCVATFLVVGIFTKNSSKKSFHYSPGIIERAEAFIFFILMINLPHAFAIIGWIFAGLMLITSYVRTHQFIKQSNQQPKKKTLLDTYQETD